MTQTQINFDEPKAGKQNCRDAVREVMSDGRWWTLFEIQDELKSRGMMASVTSISARVRDLRKPAHGSLTVHTWKEAPGKVRYRVE